MGNISFKLIFRSWLRNKTFTVISILSLAVGIACTNLLAAFVIHEYNIEQENPNKDRMGHRCICQEKRFLTQWINRRCKTAFPGRKESDRKSSAYSWGLFSYHTKTAGCRCLPVSCSNILRGNVPKAIVIGGLQAEKCWRRTERS